MLIENYFHKSTNKPCHYSKLCNMPDKLQYVRQGVTNAKICTCDLSDPIVTCISTSMAALRSAGQQSRHTAAIV